MGFWDDVSRFAGNATGGFLGDSDEERRRRKQQRAQSTANNSLRPPLATQSQRQAQAGATNLEVSAGAPVAQAKPRPPLTPFGRGITRQNQMEDGLNQGKSFEDISTETGMGLAEVADYAERTRPGYGKQPFFDSVQKAAGQFVDGVVGDALTIPRKVGITAEFSDPQSQKKLDLQALQDSYNKGDITSTRLLEDSKKLTEDVIGKKIVADEQGNISLTDKNPLEFGQGFTGAGADTYSVLPIATGAKAAIGGVGLVKTMLKESGIYGTVDTANDIVQGRATPEQTLANYTMNAGMAGMGHVAGKVYRDFKGAQALPDAERGSIQLPEGNIPKTKEEVMAKLEAMRAGGQQSGYIDKTPPKIDSRPETLLARATEAGMTPETAAAYMKEHGANKFRVMLDTSNNLAGAKNPDALALHALRAIPDGSKTIGGTAKQNDMLPNDEVQMTETPATPDAPPAQVDDPLAGLREAEKPRTPEQKATRLKIAHNSLEGVTDDKGWARDKEFIKLGTDNDAKRMAQVLERRMRVLDVIQKDAVAVITDKNQMVHYVDRATGQEIASHHVDDLVDKVTAYAKLKQLANKRDSTPTPEPAKDYNQPQDLPAEKLMGPQAAKNTADPIDTPTKPAAESLPPAPEAPPKAPKTQNRDDVSPAPKDAPKVLQSALPKKDATVKDVADDFPKFRDYVGKSIEHIRAKLKEAGVTESEFVRAMITERHTTTKMTPAMKKIYKEELAPILEYARKNSATKLGDGRGGNDVYFHERGKNTPDATTEIYGSVVETIDTQFGASKSNKGKLVTDKDGNLTFKNVDDSLGAYQNYFDQWYIDRYKAQMLSKKSKKPVEYHKAEQELGQKIGQKIDGAKVTDDSINMEKIDYVGEYEHLGQFGRPDGTPPTPIDHKLGALRRGLTDDQSQFKAVNDIPDPKNPGKTTTMDKLFGFERFRRAENRADNLYEEFFPEGQSAYSKAELEERLMVNFADANVPEDALRGAIKSTLAGMDHIQVDRDMAKQAGDTAMKNFHEVRLRHAFNTLNKRVGREELSNALQTYKIKDKWLRNAVNYQAERMLTSDAMKRSLAHKIADQITTHVTRGALGFNLNSITMNITEMKRVYANFGAVATAKAIYRGAKNGRKLLAHYGVEPTHFENLNDYAREQFGEDVTKSLKQKLGKGYDDVMNISMAGFKLSEEFKDKVFLAAYQDKAMKMTPEQRGGMSVDDWVLDRFEKEAIKYGQFGTIGINKNPLVRTLMQFSQYWVKDATITGRKIKGAANGNGQDAAYLLRLGMANTALYSVLGSTLGSSFSMIFNSQVPTGGPALDFVIDTYNAFQEQEDNKNQLEAEGKPADDPSVSKAAERALRKDAALVIPGGNQIVNKTGAQAFLPDSEDKGIGSLNPKNFWKDGYYQDRKREFNKNSKGRDRFAIDQENVVEHIKGAINGSYNQKNAKEYFGTTDIRSGIPIIGHHWRGQSGVPAWKSVQDEIDKAGTIEEKQKIFNEFKDQRREDAATEKEFLKTADAATVAEYYRLNGKALKTNQSQFEKLGAKIGFGEEARKVDELFNGPQNAYYATQYGSDGRKASDLISPEKWKIQWDSPGVFKKEKEDALARNKRDGAPVDPIYTSLQDSTRLKEMLQLRSAATGDMVEREEILRATAPWYNEFKEKEKKYYEDSKAFFDKLGLGDDKENLRVLEYGKLSVLVEQPPLVKKYFETIESSGKTEANKMFKTYGDAMSVAFDTYSKARLDQINAKRKIEGHDPISPEVFKNKTYGFTGNADGTDKASGWSKWGSGSAKVAKTGIEDTITNFGNASKGITMPKGPAKTLKDPTKAVKKMKRASGSSSLRINI